MSEVPLYKYRMRVKGSDRGASATSGSCPAPCLPCVPQDSVYNTVSSVFNTVSRVIFRPSKRFPVQNEGCPARSAVRRCGTRRNSWPSILCVAAVAVLLNIRPASRKTYRERYCCRPERAYACPAPKKLRRRPTVGAQGGAVSYERGTHVQVK